MPFNFTFGAGVNSGFGIRPNVQQQIDEQVQLAEALADANKARNIESRTTSAVAQMQNLYPDMRELSPVDMLGLQQNLGSQLADPSVSTGQAVSSAMLRTPQGQQAAMARQEQAEEAELYAMRKREADAIAAEQAVRKNREEADRNFMTPEQWAGANRTMGGLARALDTASEIENFIVAGDFDFAGAGAAGAKWLAQSLEGQIMELLNTGVINSPSEQARVERMGVVISGLKAGGTLDESQYAKIVEFQRYIDQRIRTEALATGIDPAAHRGYVRSAAEIRESWNLDAAREQVKTDSANELGLDDGPGADIPEQELPLVPVFGGFR